MTEPTPPSAPEVTPASPSQPYDGLALVLGGGGARGAYQAGVLRAIAKRFPDVRFPILTGISAGAVNTIQLASHRGTSYQATDDLVSLWLKLDPENVYDVHVTPLLRNVVNWGARLSSGGRVSDNEPMRGAVNTGPLREYLQSVLELSPDGTLPGIAANLAQRRLRAVALSATSYTTGQAVSWVQGENVELWQRPQRRSEFARLTVDHVMASSALPILFPAVEVNNEWFGDGGVRLTAPLSPALHLGAHKILTISTRYARTRAEADAPLTRGYPPPAQVLSVLYNAIFLDLIDEDIMRLQKVNRLLSQLPKTDHQGMRIVEILVLRPSRDLGKLARDFEVQLPRFIRWMSRGLGTKETQSPDILSLILFQHDYLKKLVELGEADVDAQAERVGAFLATAK